MLQRWMKTLAVLSLSGMLFSACRKSEFSTDEPFPESFSPTVYISSQNNFLYALNPGTGVKKWELKLSGTLQATPVLQGNFLYLAMDSLVKVDARRGTYVRSYYKLPFRGFEQLYYTPAVDGEMMYLASAVDTMFAFDTKNEVVSWRYADGAGRFMSAPIVRNGLVIAGNENGSVYALDKLTGTLAWKFTAPGGAPFTASPAINGNTVYATCQDGRLYALDLGTGTEKWNYATRGPIVSSPIAYGGNIVFGSNDYHVYCIDTIAKQPRWIYRTGDRIVSAPYGEANMIYVGSYDYTLYAINILDGVERWKFKTGALINSSPMIYNGMVYTGSFDKNLYAIDTAGNLKWKHNTNGLIESSPIAWDLTKAIYPSNTGMSVY